MTEHGLQIRESQGMSRVSLRCDHLKGLLYVVPGEKSWVCSPQRMTAHALAGFLGELVELQSPAVAELMNRWGVYFRRLPPEDEEEPPDPPT